MTEPSLFRRSLSSRLSSLALLAAGAAALLLAQPAQAQNLTVYTALETDQLRAYQTAFEKSNPGITITWVRDSTGIITARLLAEKANPRADVVMGVAASSLALLGAEGMLVPYAPKGLDRVLPQYRDRDNPPSWVGMNVWGTAICFNEREAAKRGIPQPKSWRDLLNPVYRGQIVMPHPASSGTGFLAVTGWQSLWGEAEAWKFMDGLHENIAQYMHSGSRPCARAAAGEFVVGISFDYRANREKAQGAPIQVIFPEEGIGWDLESIAIQRGTKHLAAAQRLLDWAASDEAMQLYANNFALVAVPRFNQQLPNIPADYAQRLVRNDFAAMARSRDRVLAEWSRRFESKAAPR